jgi:hypothetical protein
VGEVFVSYIAHALRSVKPLLDEQRSGMLTNRKRSCGYCKGAVNTVLATRCFRHEIIEDFISSFFSSLPSHVDEKCKICRIHSSCLLMSLFC